MKKRKKLSGISYYGGKYRMASKILKHFPPHTVYVEPFVGGASVMFMKGLPPINRVSDYVEVINDKDEKLINLYRYLRDDPKLIELLKMTPYSRSEYNKAKEIYKECSEGLEAAWSMYVLIYQSFAHIVGGGFGIGVVTRNMAMTWERRLIELDDFVKRLRGVTIEYGDALEIIKRWDSPQTLFYCDPPYPGTIQEYNLPVFDVADYQDLCDTLDGCKGSFVLSCYAQGIEPVYWKRYDFEAFCSASAVGRVGAGRDTYKIQTAENMSDRRRTESIFVMDRSSTAREDLHHILWSPSKGFVYRDLSIELVRNNLKTDILDSLFGG